MSCVRVDLVGEPGSSGGNNGRGSECRLGSTPTDDPSRFRYPGKPVYRSGDWDTDERSRVRVRPTVTSYLGAGWFPKVHPYSSVRPVPHPFPTGPPPVVTTSKNQGRWG